MIINDSKSPFKRVSYEAENTRKLLTAIPDSALNYKPSDINWTTAQLASHIANIYDWFPYTLEQPAFDLKDYKYEKEDYSKAENIVARFEENFQKAKVCMEKLQDHTLMENWSLTMGGHNIIPTGPRYVAARSFLFNHLYHHRGELVVYLRASGHKVPGLYGPTAEQGLKQP